VVKFRVFAVSILLVVVVLVVLTATSKLPDNSARPVSHVISDGYSTRIGRAYAPSLEAHPDQSVVHLLADGRDAFVGRAISARQARIGRINTLFTQVLQ
jgi:hypothetical protein